MKLSSKNNELGTAALYCRLSWDDNMDTKSNSISNQKRYLEGYAADHGYSNLVHYTDDGWSGGNFDRPAWKKLISDIEAGKVAHLLVKDLSRVGRDYLQTGFYTEVVFKRYGIHFVAIGNSIDSNDPQLWGVYPLCQYHVRVVLARSEPEAAHRHQGQR